MTAKPAPGPWKWGPHYNGLFGADGSKIMHWEPYEGMFLTCDNDEAHAALIASAPVLRDALRTLLAECNWEREGHTPGTRAALAALKLSGPQS